MREKDIRFVNYNVMTCDGGSHKRKDRKNGGLYVVRCEATTCLSVASHNETVIVCLKK